MPCREYQVCSILGQVALSTPQFMSLQVQVEAQPFAQLCSMSNATSSHSLGIHLTSYYPFRNAYFESFIQRKGP